MRKIFLVISLGLLVSACQKADNVVIDSSQPINVQLNYFDRDSIDIAQYINNTAAQPAFTDSFRVSLSSVSNFGRLDVSAQNDSGNVIGSASFSSVTGDSLAGSITITPSTVYVGNITYTLTAYNSLGAPGNGVTKLVRLFNSQDHPPVIDSVSVPDSVQIDTSNYILFGLYATVHDPDGLNDLAKVYFNTTKPDGNPSSGNPFLMYDDGGASNAVGDEDPVAHDGIYTLVIQLSPGTPPGIYKFTFYAVDRSGVSSSPVTCNIKVYQ